MTEPIFSEKRTRSQLTLPDNILQIPNRSPLKDARTALRNHTVTHDACSSPADDTDDDELLLSPGKSETQMKTATKLKRSASPPLQDEYSPLSGSSSEARELKRLRRDGLSEEDNKSDIENVKARFPSHQRTIAGHTRNNSEPNIVGRRSARKRSATTSNKPISTVSASPTPTIFSPAPSSPRKGRAQSVPLFPTTHDIPRIDFRNPPPSPKRRRSPSRSPSKDREPKLRITSSGFAVSPKLFTIHDDVATSMVQSDDESSIPEEMEMPAVPSTPEGSQPSKAASEIIPASPPTLLHPTAPSILLSVPATPASQSLNQLIPMSPLTPLPETPLPTRLMTSADAEDRYASDTGWGIAPMKVLATSSQLPKPQATAPSTSKSRLPRPSAAPPVPPLKASRPSTMGPPTLATTQSKATAARKQDMSSAPKKDAFALMMKEPLEKRARLEKEKAKMKEKEKAYRSVPPLIFAPVGKGKEPVVAGPSAKPKLKLKEKMRPREKPEPKKPLLLVPLPDEEDEEHTEPESASQTDREDAFMEPPPPRISPGPPVTVPVAAVDAIIADEGPDMAPLRDRDTKMMEVDALEEQEEKTPLAVVPEARAEVSSPVLEGDATSEVQHHTQETSAPSFMEDSGKLGEREEVPEPTEPRPLAKTGGSKLPLGKKRQPMSVAPASRVTRSVSNKRNNNATEGSQIASMCGPSRKKPTTTSAVPVPAKRTASGAVKKSLPPVEASEDVLVDAAEEKEQPLPPGSPMKVSSPAKGSPAKGSSAKKDEVETIQFGAGTLSLAKTPTKSRSYLKPVSTPSPTKNARLSLFSTRPSAPGITRAFSSSQLQTGPSSSLSTLSNALEKLRMPPPSRPNTSMGFNRDAPGADDSFEAPARSKGDVTVERPAFATGRLDGASSSKSAASSSKNLVQKPLSMFMSNKSGVAKPTGRLGLMGNKHSVFGVGGGPRRTIKENDADADADADDAGDEDGGKIFNAIIKGSSATLLLENLLMQGPDKGKQRETSTRPSHSSRRVSMLSRDLSQSLSALPPPSSDSRGIMGPPATPPSAGRTANRSTSSYPSSSSGSPSQAGPSGATRSSARIAKTAPGALMKIKGGTDGHVSSGRKGAAEPSPPPNPAAEALKVLKDCVIFVDVKTDDGDEAGSLFVEMLEGVGARVLTRVGQTCTHIVFKNGLMSTITRYRLLRDPKPFVVGIAWVVDCVEQRKLVDETDFLVDLEHTHVAGNHKTQKETKVVTEIALWTVQCHPRRWTTI
ncbi:hypothetical protein BDZ97DRAFT_2073318 [Flammula alnicola]|nr:hypothetical protein BDZ97DRAFT_2073318 [Flammula alnicola]